MREVEFQGVVVGVLAMALVVLISNIAVGYPINEWLTLGAFTYPVAFLVTDLTNRLFGSAPARKVVYAGFVAGVAMSFILADPRIAIASGLAFLVAHLLDIAIFDRMRRQIWWKAPLFSSLTSSAVDTMLFFTIAFYATGLPWITMATGDYGAKLLMAVALLAPFRLFVSMLPEHLRKGPDGVGA